MGKCFGQRLVCKQHLHSTIRFSLYSATQLQPFEQRRYAQSRAAIHKSSLPWPGNPREADAMVQSSRISCASSHTLGQPWFLWQLGKRYFDWTRLGDLGLLDIQGNCVARTAEPSISR